MINLLLSHYLNEVFKNLFEASGFLVLWAKTLQDLEKIVSSNQIDLAIEWQHSRRDFIVRDLLNKYDKNTKIFLALNWNGKIPSDFNDLGYFDVLEVPFNIKDIRSKFYNALPNNKKKILKQLSIWNKMI